MSLKNKIITGLLALMLVCIVICMPAILELWVCFNYNFINPQQLNIEERGQIGDSFGIINSALTFFTLCGVIIGLWYQRKQLANQQYQMNEEKILSFIKKYLDNSDEILKETIIYSSKTHSKNDYLSIKIRNLEQFIPNLFIPLNDKQISHLEKNFEQVKDELSILYKYLSSIKNIFDAYNDIRKVFKLDKENDFELKRLITRLIPKDSITLCFIINQAGETIQSNLLKSLNQNLYVPYLQFNGVWGISKDIIDEYSSVNGDEIEKLIANEKSDYEFNERLQKSINEKLGNEGMR